MKARRLLFTVLSLIVLTGCTTLISFPVPEYEISGTVTDVNGDPISGVKISFRGRVEVASVTTNAQGEWSRDGLWGPVLVVPEHPLTVFSPMTIEVDDFATDVNFVGDVLKPVLYDAIAQFSDQQGRDQWFYEYWDGSTYESMTYDPANNRWAGPEEWLFVADHWVHPSLNMEPVRKWVAPGPGEIRIFGQVRMGDGNPAPGADGVMARIFHNDELIFERDVAAGDVVGYPYDIVRSVAAGDAIYFRINAKGGTASDNTVWEEKIDYQPVI